MKKLNYSSEFTIAHGLATQQRHLQHWRQRLNAACYDDLCTMCAELNSKLNGSEHCGHDVFRGQQIAEFVANWSPTN